MLINSGFFWSRFCLRVQNTILLLLSSISILATVALWPGFCVMKLIALYFTKCSLWTVAFATCFVSTQSLVQAAAPYPQSSVIIGINFDWSTHQRGALGSDNFGLAWADDDNLYGTWGDGSGFNSTDVSMGVSQISGSGSSWIGTDVWSGGPRNSTDPITQPFSGKSWATLAVNDALYMWFVPDVPDEPAGETERDHYAYTDLAKSTDYGLTWNKTGIRFHSTDNLTIPAFINFGKNNAGARDEYIYSYFSKPQPTGMTQQEYDLSVHLPGEIYLARVKATEMEVATSSFEWFQGTDANGNPLWGSLSQKTAVFNDPDGVGWTISAHYNAGLNRYILTTQHTISSVGSLGIFDAPEPWGPWTTVKYWTPVDFFGKTRPGDSLAWKNNVFFIDFATKWISENGKNFTLNFTGAGRGKDNDSFNTLSGNFELAGSGGPLFEDDFNDGSTTGWSVIDNCSTSSSNWSVVNTVLMQTGACRGYNPEGLAEGTALLTNASLTSNIDIRLRLRAQDPELDAVSSNDGDTHKYGAMGVAFGYQNSNNYYRFELSGIKGERRLWRKQNGNYTELNTSPQSYVRGQWLNLRILHQNGIIVVYIDDQQVMSTADNTFTAGKLALFCARNVSCSFDDVVVDAAPLDPVIGLNLPDGGAPTHASSEYFVDTGSILDVTALSTQTPGIGGVEFVIDAGTGFEVSATDTSPPYNAQFALSAGEHSVSAMLLDSSAVGLTTPDASAVFSQVGIGGLHIACLGDSITAGLTDDIVLDDFSADSRNTGGGYEPVLNNYLSAANGIPVTVLNEGLSGDKSLEAAARIEQVLARFPAAEIFLVSYGTNDSKEPMPLTSGLGLASNHPDYPGSYKDYMQQIIDAVVAAGKRIYLGKIPAYLKSAGQDVIIQSYNQVIDELMNHLKIIYPADYAGFSPPDMHTYFTDNPSEISSDEIHLNGTGYQSMARLWCEALNGQPGLYCLDNDRDGLLNSVEILQGSNPALADTDGDGLVDGSDGHVLLAAVSGGIDNNGDGYADGEQSYATDPLLADSDGDRLNDGLEAGNNADPLDPDSWPALADGDIAPLGNPNGVINAGDLLIGMRLLLGLESATALELAHGDLYPPGSPDGVFNLQDMLLLQQLY